MMQNARQHLDPIERQLAELGEAHQAGVFRRTFVDAGSLVERPATAPRRSLRRTLRWVPVAACLALVITVGTLVMRSNLHRTRPLTTHTSLGEKGGQMVGFNECVTGPGGQIINGCSAHDYDSDGDVDLADYRALQLLVEK